MKSDLIVLGVEYVVQVRQQHVVIPGTDVTYKERLKSFASLDLNTLPKAAVLERRRLEGALLYGLKSRINRCPGVYRGFIEASVSDAEITFAGDRIGIVATPVEKLARGRFRIEAHFRGQIENWMTNHVAHYFNPDIVEDMGVSEEEADELTDEEIVAQIEEEERALCDPAGTLSAIVHQAAFKYLYTDDLLDRIDAERQEEIRAHRVERQESQRRYAEENAEQIVDSAIDRITREAARPDDDEWEALA